MRRIPLVLPKILAMISIVLALAGAPARAFPPGQEPYSVVPAIEQLPAKRWQGQDPAWRRVLWGYLEAVALTLEVYRPWEKAFMARDQELAYFLARLESQGDPELLSTLHLVNVSGG